MVGVPLFIMDFREESEDEWEPDPEDTEEDLITSIFPHVFLPPRIPDSVQENLPSLELLMLQLANKSISTISDKFRELKPLSRMLNSWASLQEASKSPADFAEIFVKEITKLKVGESIACYLRTQNAGLLFTNLDNQHTVAQTFQCSFGSDMVMSNVHPLFVTFPHSTDTVVNKEVLFSKTFASQLHELSTTPAYCYIPKSSKASTNETNTTAPTTVTDPFLVTDWIVGLLVPVTMTSVNSSPEFSSIRKKIRDEVASHQSYALQPFRRSAMWTSIKVAIQLKVSHIFPSENEATVIYKLIMLHVLTTICRRYESNDRVTWSLMLAKLGRRTEKLRRMQIEEDSFVDILKQFTFKFVDTTISNINNRMNAMWKLECRNTVTIPPIEQHKVQYCSNLVHNISTLDEHMLTKMPSMSTNKTPEALLSSPSSDLRVSYDLKRCVTLDSVLATPYPSAKQILDDHKTRIWINDAERVIKSLNANDVTSSQVYELFHKYQFTSLKYYKSLHDPAGLSQVVLCTLKLVQILDCIATTKYPTLMYYASGIIHSAFDKLLLPFRDDMALLEYLLGYFSRRDKNSIYSSWFSSTEVNERDFQVQYARTNQAMVDLKRAIEVDTEAEIKKKYEEVTTVLKACKSLQDQISSLSCECKYEMKWCSRIANYVQTKISTCQKCGLEKQLKSKRCSVKIYERPLPPESDKQWAVVYELKIPNDLANLRDALAFLNYTLLDVVVPNPPTKVAWKNYMKTAPYDDKRKCEFYNLKSSVISIEMKRLKGKDVLKTPKENYVVDNGMDCLYSHSCEGISESFKFKISNTSSPDREMYLPLQYALNGTNIIQNQVIADMYTCHKDMSLAEFGSFGFLRDGHRIELRNLYAYITDSTLALEKEPVVQLIMQTLWEMGDNENYSRPRHFEFLENDAFTLDFIKILHHVVDKNETNYGNVLILLSLIVITTRIVELNSAVIPQGLHLLRKCRSVLDKWVTRINSSVDSELNEAGQVNVSLQIKLLHVSICSAFTFKLSPTIDQQLEAPDLMHWLHTITRLHELVDQDKCLLKAKDASPFVKSLVNASFNVALLMEKKIQSALPTLLKTFAVSQWSKANQCNDGIWNELKCTESCYFSIYTEKNDAKMSHLLSFDYLQGIFLVDGFPQGVLPFQIRNHPLYKTYFQNTKLKVQRDTNGFQTVAPFHSNHFDFRIYSDAIVKIKEVHDTFSFELLEPALFEDKIAKSFVDNYTHWLHSEKTRVIFRRKPVTNDDYNKPVEFALVRSEDGKSWKFENELNNKCLLARTQGFLSVCRALNSLEENSSINVMKDKTTNVVTAHLPRYGLSFVLESDHLQSVEYPDFQISLNQKLNTLIGFQRSLLLDNKSTNKKQKVIIPHGNIVLSRHGTNHQATSVDIRNLHNPPYFTYDVDPVLCRLKAQDSKEAWLYLAALHGATSSPIRDPFTGLTGTEMAVWILQSGLVWSSSPYDENCLRILRKIRDFSPKRSYYGQRLNVTRRHSEEIGVAIWPQGLNNMAAYDGFAIIVNKLIEDSNSLAALNEGKKVELEQENVSEKLSVRAYRRNVNFYNQCAGIKPLYFPKGYEQNEQVVHNLELRKTRDAYEVENLELLSQSLLETDAYSRNANCSLKPFLITKHSLGCGNKIKSLHDYTLADLLRFDFRGNWLELYSHAISPRSKHNIQERLTWNIFLAAMSYQRVDVSQLLNLHLIIKYQDVVTFPPAPTVRYPNASNHVYSDERLGSSLHKAASKHLEFLDWVKTNHSKKWLKFSDSSQKSKKFGDFAYLEKKCKSAHELYKIKFRQDCEQYIRTTVRSLQLYDGCIDGPLPAEKTQFITPSQFFTSCEQVVDVINNELQLISQCKDLVKFVESVEKLLDEVLQSCSVRHDGPEQRKVAMKHRYNPMTSITLDVTTEPYQAFEINPEELFKYRQDCDDKVPIWGPLVYHRGKIDFTDLSTRCSSLETFISNVLAESLDKQVLSTSGISPRVTPTILLQYLQKAENPSDFTTFVGALAVLWTLLQRENRIKVLKEAADATTVEQELAREENNKGYENWAPKDHPEWILLQLELDMMIRTIQVKVAQQMTEMPNGKNGVMQLNMGEGKTSVIIPMLCAALASCDSLVRVTVLKSIFATNQKILSFTIGGLLNRRVYVFPCRRDMEVNEQVLETINIGFKTCLDSRGVILTLPEYRLSFRLKIYDEINKGNVALGLQMMETEAWLRAHVRDMLDESDELLSVKYQLVYTVGTQIQIDGNDLRWKICQRLLELVQSLAPQLTTSFGSSVVEYDSKPEATRPEQFEHFRFLSESCKATFYDLLGAKVLDDVMLSTSDKSAVKTFITHENPPMTIHKRVQEITKDSKDLYNKILLLAGYIGRGILYLALTKRWRVEYGVDPKGHRLMAVPFRAKDVAAEKTEFGHPDLAIVVTQLSYYYSGLSDHEMNRTFECLKSKNSPAMIYSSWVQKLSEDQLPQFLSSYEGINLKDSYQRTHLFKLLRRHKSVIDFYLSEKVFPKESKQFPGKMSMSAWDLCHEKNSLAVSGFSGTNDSSVLLPLAIKQQDLEQLAQTNVKLERTLLKPENHGHLGLQMGVTCEEILKKMTEDGLRVLIDAGALMLELDNEQVASLWLAVDPSVEATVYFNHQNEILVKTRAAVGGQTVEDMRLEFSPFRNRLGACGVFLDDQHTRGTDLNFPTGSRACVTVGTRMRREKLMQATMRMRKLGNGHSVAFYLSHEVFDKVTSKSICGLQTSDIITWVRANTREFNDDGLVHWAMAGKNYAQKLAAEEMFERQLKTFEAAKIMGAQVVDQEVTLLEKLYGVYTKSELLVQVIPKLFQVTKQKLVVDNNSTPLSDEVERLLDTVCSSIVSRCQEFVPRKTYVCSALEDEQEKELEKEVEVEEERQMRRPRKAEHVIPTFDPNIWNMLKDGEIIAGADGIVRISDVFSRVSFAKQIQPAGWSKSVYATRDFASVIKMNHFVCTDLHLRPVEYVAVRIDPASKTVQMLVLSPFEVNHLIPFFRERLPVFTLHMFAIRRTERQDILMNNSALQVPFREIRVDETDPALACLHVAAGSLYFDSRPEAKAYAGFLGLVAQPWSDAQRKAFENGWISKTGFKLPQDKVNRRSTRLSSSQIGEISVDEVSSLFQSDPGNLVRSILACRHPENVNEVAHVIKLLEFLTLPFSS